MIPARPARMVLLGLEGGAIIGCSPARLPAPSEPYTAEVDDTAVTTSVDGIQTRGDSGCVWTGERSLLVFSVHASVDPTNSTLHVGKLALSEGDRFVAGTPPPITGGYDCGGIHWDSALHVPGTPSAP